MPSKDSLTLAVAVTVFDERDLSAVLQEMARRHVRSKDRELPFRLTNNHGALTARKILTALSKRAAKRGRGR